MESSFDKYLSRLDVWALSFGCIIGWGSFVMPGTTYLKAAGPGGTVIAMAIGVLVTLRALDDPQKSHVPIIAMTANAFREDIKVAMEAGMQAHIAKPIDVNTMMTTIEQVLRRE